MLAGILVDLNVVISETALFIRERAVDQLLQLPDLKRFELKNLGARNERTVYIKERIVSGRSDQPEISAFDIGEENILLRFVKVVDLVDEQDRLLTRCAKPIRRSGDAAPRCLLSQDRLPPVRRKDRAREKIRCTTALRISFRFKQAADLLSPAYRVIDNFDYEHETHSCSD